MISRLLRKFSIGITICAALCVFAFAAETATVSANGGLNFRTSASTSAQVICAIPSGTAVSVISKDANWAKISYAGREGYVSVKYLSFGATAAVPTSSAAAQKRTNLINYAATFLGTPYRSGGAGPNGFDCSGFTYYVCSKFGISLPRGPASQYNALGTSISKANLKPGDLVFFKNPYAGRSIGHVGIYVGNGQMIHSNKPGGSVRYVTINSGYYATNYVGARRVIFD